ncbi:hypothetical protein GOBAR_AA38593 [Gossypium barbadense]|uniref:Metallothionein-like protein n=2 Tax=Gossypium barbadense TaxID=3634 RepID=A0A2P5VTE9_GOSBA|nr:hypothetical protein GOBAR_DD29428 [Gossypium barbadense]PPR82115.1 hypothetical protein GOBAR_AA38593 [Gossypium barbadense]
MSSGCNCGSSCSCGLAAIAVRTARKMNLNLGYSEKTTSTQTIISGVAPVKMTFEGPEMGTTESGHGCSCGSSCKCNPCTC